MHFDRSSVRITLPLLLPLALAVAGCGANPGSGSEPTESTQQALAPHSDAAFIVSGNLTGGPYCGSGYNYNSAPGGTICYVQTGTGQYQVTFSGLGTVAGGDVQVGARGSGARCKSIGWHSSGGNLIVNIACFSPGTGSLTNSLFTANYLRRTDQPGPEGAYVWAFNASSSSYNASSAYAWNSTGSAITITHVWGPGIYSVSLPGQNLAAGTVEVTAYDNHVVPSNAYCKVGGWGGTGVSVDCFDGSTGQPTDSMFTMVFSTKSPNNIQSFFYAWTDQPNNPNSYTPNTNYQLGSIYYGTDSNGYPLGQTQSPAYIVHNPNNPNPGDYIVYFPGMHTGSQPYYPDNVRVTGYGNRSDTCNIVGWGWDTWAPTMSAEVYCFDRTGNPVNAEFTITYSSFAYIIP